MNKPMTVSEREVANLKEQFAQKLYKLLVGKNWTQAQLARNGGFTPNQVSTWINARSLPSPHSLMKLTQIFNVEADDLVPGYNTVLEDPERSPVVDMRVVQGKPGTAHLHVNVMVPTAVAVQIIGIISDQQNSN